MILIRSSHRMVDPFSGVRTGSDTVDAADEVSVGDGGVACLNGPHGLR